MSIWIALVLAAGCHSKTKAEADARALPKPEAAAFSKLTDDQKCDAVAARALPCEGELFKALITSTLGSDIKDPTLDEDPDSREAETMQRIACFGDRSYAPAVVTCWTSDGCRAFAACVTAHEQPVTPSKP